MQEEHKKTRVQIKDEEGVVIFNDYLNSSLNDFILNNKHFQNRRGLTFIGGSVAITLTVQENNGNV